MQKICLYQRPNGWWEATPWGKMATILAPNPDKLRPARSANWRTPEEAVADLEARWGYPVKVMRCVWNYPPLEGDQ
jgi:hypothetical protein